MKYVILVGDGMGDYPIAELGGKTPLAAAHTPHMDWIADHGELGLARTIPQGCETGSDTANLSILGYDPKQTLTRRAPLEAASLGIHLSDIDVAFRCNLVTLSMSDGILTMEDYSAGHISTDEARLIVEDLDRALGDETFRFYPGVSYRHLMIWHGGPAEVATTPPHDITGQAVQPYLDHMAPQEVLLQLMDRAGAILRGHPINKKRVEKGLKPANHIWFWGQGHAPHIEAFEKKTGLKGAMISAVDLLRGIGVYAGFEVIRVPGATGYFDTDYEAKAAYALSAIKGVDLVYVHVEAPDEAGHAGLLDKKIAAIEAFDAKVVGKVLEGMKGFSEYRIMVTTDHYTPISVRTHTTEPVPFAICGTGISAPSDRSGGFNEEKAKARGLFLADGYKLIERFISLPK
ncbi:MAG: cofactor-independent phosphoglycerate mutase [Deltaproteobacteria bacterium]|nr:cofactor-independent phosphoglycerate mutase [Deltaproteobacteria bacterium]MBW2075211.1 cofactor-independent phosphoglycerate mutase [Deltaproteobacteria bacterium]